VHLSHKGVAKYVLVHRLVLTTFVGDCPKGYECLHADNDPTNNQLSNLSWGTRRRNHSTIDRTGQKNGRCKLTPEQVTAIRNSTETHAVLAKTYNVARGYISTIKTGRTWKCMMQN